MRGRAAVTLSRAAAALGAVSLVVGSLVVGSLVAATPVTRPSPARARVGLPLVRLVPTAIVDAGLAASSPPTTATCRAQSRDKVACYDPQQLQAAYDVGPLYAKGVEGQHQTIVIVDAFGSPTIASDLKAFDAAFSLPAPPSFRILRPRGPIPPYSPSAKDRFGWASETSLDVEWAHALAPKASIVLVETPTDEVEGTTGFPDIVAAENYVVAHRLGTVISQSFGATEQTFASRSQVTALRSAYVAASKAGISVLAGSGDLGATDYEYNAKTIYPFRVTGWPSSDPLVTGVGGTRLDLDGSGTAISRAVAWNDTYLTYLHHVPAPSASGGGLSELFSRPAYQDAVRAVTGSRRGVPDVAMSAACSGLVDVYLTPDAGLPGWFPMCGTSEATPLFAAVVALADQEAGRGLGPLNPALYALLGAKHSGLVPVTSGNNTVTFEQGSKRVTVTGFESKDGYNLVTGVGTVDAALFVPALVKEWKALRAR